VGSADSGIVTVNEGTGAIGWHAEASFTPLWPDFLFFFCVNSPRDGGETLLVDGVDVYDSLCEQAQQRARQVQLFHTREARFDVPDEIAAFLGLFKVNSRSELEAVFSNIPVREDEQWSHLTRADAVKYVYSHPLVRRGKWSTRLGICGFLPELPMIGDDVLLPDDLYKSISDAATSYRYLHRWRDGEVLIIDNTRMMHARNAVTDQARKIVLRIGNERHSDCPKSATRIARGP